MHPPIHICQSEQKRYQHLPKGSQCDCRIRKFMVLRTDGFEKHSGCRQALFTFKETTKYFIKKGSLACFYRYFCNRAGHAF